MNDKLTLWASPSHPQGKLLTWQMPTGNCLCAAHEKRRIPQTRKDLRLHAEPLLYNSVSMKANQSHDPKNTSNVIKSMNKNNHNTNN